MSSPFQKNKAEEPTDQPMSASQKAELIKVDVIRQSQAKQAEAVKDISSFDWKQVPPPMLAQMLVQIPFKGSAGEPDYFLAPWQAMIFAMRCFELGLSPFSNEVWFNTKNNKVNVTFEGKLKLARSQGLNLGPPHFERLTRKIPMGMPNAGKDDYGYKCSMTTGRNNDEAEYTAWHSEWFVAKSPVWKDKPDHMLQLRSAEKCLSFASGIGSSELMGEQDLITGEEAHKVLPEITTSDFQYKEMDANSTKEN